jgi:hypothetical protein
MSRKQENKEEDKVFYTDPKTGKRELVRAEIVAKLNKVKDQLNSRRIVADVWYDLDKHSFEWEDSDGHYRSYNGENFILVKDVPISVLPPNTGSHVKHADNPALESDVAMDAVRGNLLAEQMSKSPWGDLPPTQQKIHELMGAMKDLLLYKNQKYGDSAINPKKIFYKGDSTNSILIRLDDKIGRVMSNTEEKPRVNDVCDIIGYCTLLLISMGVTAEDIAKFKD